MEQQNKTVYFEWLRCFAAAAVVLMHTAGSRWLSISYTLPEWEMLTAWDSLVRWPVPIFIMITGALFLPRKTDLRRMLTRYIPRMAVCWLLWSAFYGLHRGALSLQTLLSGHYHLWYLPFLCGVYLVLPFLQKIAEDDRLADQLLAVCCVIGLAIPWLVDFLAFLLPEHTDLLRTLEGTLNYAFFFDHTALLLLGHRLHKTELTSLQRRVLYGLGLLGVAVTGIATVWVTRRENFQSSLFYDFTAPQNLCTAGALFVFAKYHLTRLPKWVNRLSGWSFGIYLVHPLVIELLAEEGLSVLAYAPLWWTPVLAAAVFAISAAAAAILTKIPVVGKYLV